MVIWPWAIGNAVPTSALSISGALFGGVVLVLPTEHRTTPGFLLVISNGVSPGGRRRNVELGWGSVKIGQQEFCVFLVNARYAP